MNFIKNENLDNAQFKKNYVYEVAKNKTESKYIANDLANAKRYAYRAKVVVLGNASVRPYDPIYLDGLPNGLSGYWTVLSVRHLFNSADVQYKMELEVGTDKIGETNPNASQAVPVRDVEAELAGQSLDPATPTLIDIPVSVNSSSLVTSTGTTSTTAVTSPYNAVPATITEDIYSYSSPTPLKITDTTKWIAI